MTKTADDILERLRVEREELLDVAEQVLEQMAVDPQGVDPSDKFVFQVLGMSEEDVRREVSRMNSVIKWRPMAGTNAEYAEAVETLDALQKSVPEEVERIQCWAEVSHRPNRRSLQHQQPCKPLPNRLGSSLFAHLQLAATRRSTFDAQTCMKRI